MNWVRRIAIPIAVAISSIGLLLSGMDLCLHPNAPDAGYVALNVFCLCVDAWLWKCLGEPDVQPRRVVCSVIEPWMGVDYRPAWAPTLKKGRAVR